MIDFEYEICRAAQILDFALQDLKRNRSGAYNSNLHLNLNVKSQILFETRLERPAIIMS
jgi:hypothetical protein